MQREVKFRVWYPHDDFGPAYLYPDTRLGHVKFGDKIPKKFKEMGADAPIIHGPSCGSDSLVVELTLDGKIYYLGGVDDKCVLEQFTGLKDKNGKEIYEGDIVRYSRRGGIIADSKIYIKLVKWNGIYFALSLPKETDTYEDMIADSWKVLHSEVIGNIHENPELLK